MNYLVGIMFLVTSCASVANDREAYAKMSLRCFEKTATVLHDELYHTYESENEGYEKAEIGLGQISIMKTMMKNSSRTCEKKANEQRISCLIDTSTIAIKTLVEVFSAKDLVNELSDCELTSPSLRD